jgi:MscS family membrane protein
VGLADLPGEITRRFSVEGIDFAFPTRTLHLANDAKRQLKIELLESGCKRP